MLEGLSKSGHLMIVLILLYRNEFITFRCLRDFIELVSTSLRGLDSVGCVR